MSGNLQIQIGKLQHRYGPKGVAMVHKSLLSSSNSSKMIARNTVGIKRIALVSLEEVGQDAKQAFLIGGVWAEGEDVLSSDAGVFGEQAMFDL
jgi:hypothetical protein